MTSILNLKNKYSVILLFAVIILTPALTSAQQSLSLSVTPPLFQLTVLPEQSWQSAIKIINTNNFDLTLYATPVNFAPVGEGGQGDFVPIFETETDGKTLAEWITVTNDPIIVPREQSLEVPFSIAVPSDAPPGGHFAAILIGTRPSGSSVTPMAVQTSQMVSSLLFMRIEGDVLEQGRIREFYSSENFFETPEAEFTLRFENSGNVHIRPQGVITIYNMWGKKRGEIPINQVSNFGNVLPGSIRKFSFSWKGEWSFGDIGRYTADVVLTYGQNARQNVSQTTAFWVIPLKGLVAALLLLFILIWSIRWAIKSYVRHMLINAGIDPGEHAAHKAKGDVAMLKKISKQSQSTNVPAVIESSGDTSDSFLKQFIRNHIYFIVGIPSIIILLSLLFWFISSALTGERSYEVKVDTQDGRIETINSEEIKLQELSDTVLKNEGDQSFDLHIVNVSGEPGAAANAAVLLEGEGMHVTSVRPDFERIELDSIIVSTGNLQSEAKKFSDLFDEALVSFVENESERPAITIFVGRDMLDR